MTPGVPIDGSSSHQENRSADIVLIPIALSRLIIRHCTSKIQCWKCPSLPGKKSSKCITSTVQETFGPSEQHIEYIDMSMIKRTQCVIVQNFYIISDCSVP